MPVFAVSSEPAERTPGTPAWGLTQCRHVRGCTEGGCAVRRQSLRRSPDFSGVPRRVPQTSATGSEKNDKSGSGSSNKPNDEENRSPGSGGKGEEGDEKSPGGSGTKRGERDNRDGSGGDAGDQRSELLRGVWGEDASDVWAVGTSSTGTALRARTACAALWPGAPVTPSHGRARLERLARPPRPRRPPAPAPLLPASRPTARRPGAARARRR